jgi:hypothetical protein
MIRHFVTHQPEESMRTMASKFARLTGTGLALAAGAAVAFGVAPASAANHAIGIPISYHGTARPTNDQLEPTRGAAERECYAYYGYRARGVTLTGFGGSERPGGGFNWTALWNCESN